MARGFKTGGRQKGTPNKMTSLVRDTVLQAGAEAHPEGLKGYLREQAIKNPTAFLSLIGRIIPTQVETGDNGFRIVIDGYAEKL